MDAISSQLLTIKCSSSEQYDTKPQPQPKS